MLSSFGATSLSLVVGASDGLPAMSVTVRTSTWVVLSRGQKTVGFSTIFVRDVFASLCELALCRCSHSEWFRVSFGWGKIISAALFWSWQGCPSDVASQKSCWCFTNSSLACKQDKIDFVFAFEFLSDSVRT